jgi:hypothetical protein
VRRPLNAGSCDSGITQLAMVIRLRQISRHRHADFYRMVTVCDVTAEFPQSLQ